MEDTTNTDKTLVPFTSDTKLLNLVITLPTCTCKLKFHRYPQVCRLDKLVHHFTLRTVVP